jgi:hypothetical protein
MSRTINKHFNYINKWTTQHNLGIDAIASAVTWHRLRMMPLKTIYVSMRYWSECLHWLEGQRKKKRITDEQFDMVVVEKSFDFDSVEIKPSELLLSSKPMIFEFHEKATDKQIKQAN